jgi:hypothetical protein
MATPFRTTRLLLSCSVMAILAGCSGGGSKNNSLAVNHAPTATAPMASPGDSPLKEFATYTFSTTASDPDLGDSVASVTWDFGDGTAPVTVTSAPTFSVPHVFSAPLTSVTVSATPKDSYGLAGTTVTTAFQVAAAPNPFTLAVTSSPTTVQSVPLGGAGQVVLDFTIDYAGSSTWTTADITFASDATGTSAPAIVSKGGDAYEVTLTYPAGATVGSTYTATPTVKVKDALGTSSDVLSFPEITIRTVGASAAPPTIAISQPASLNTQIFALQTATLGLSITDPGQFDTTVKVDWGDGTTPASFTLPGTGLDQGAAPGTAPTHVYQTAGTFTVTISATDTQTSNNTATPQTRNYTVLANALPTVKITSPQASGSLPSSIDAIATIMPSGMTSQLNLPGGTNYPQVVVIPMNGQLNFAATATGPGSGDNYTIKWTFPGGNPGTSTDLNPGSVSFSGVSGQIVAYLVEAVATDAFQRTSNQVGLTTSDADKAVATAPAYNTTTYRKWVVVDGTQTQTFFLNFLYRQMGDTTTNPAALFPVTTAANGFGASVQIFQDGVSNTYAVKSGSTASINVPVRSNLPFWISVPSFGADSLGYVLRIPNAPTGTFMDPSLVAADHPAAATSSSFAFQNTSAPFNPVLNLVTGQGYAAEGTSPAIVNFQGHASLYGNVPGDLPKTDRWFNLLSVPGTDATATQDVVDNNIDNSFSGIQAYQAFPAWVLYQKTQEPDQLSGETPADSNSSAEGGPSDFGFNFDYATYSSLTAKSKTFTTVGLEAFRVPPGVVDPYSLSNGLANWNNATCVADLKPKQITDSGTLGFLGTMIYANPGSTALAGGIGSVQVPYDPNDPNRTVLASPQTRQENQGRPVFASAEYLWSSVWMRPLVLNSAQLCTTDSANPAAFPWFRYSNPATWPSYTSSPAILPDGSTFNLTANGGGVFDGGSPVSVSSTTAPDAKAVGRFWWTAYNPMYNSAFGAFIARTWIASPTGPFPTTFDGTAASASNALGFMTPIDPVVDKRLRDANGVVLSNTSTGGYRITWFNPTKTADGKTCVPPDFWVVEITANGAVRHFLLPASFPAAPTDGSADHAQTLASQVLTDARTYLPSGNAATAGPAAGDNVAPGYCWFDLPSELRPQSGEATIAIFALKSILANHPASALNPRPLNRTDWIDAVKNATATIKVQPNAGKDLAYAYKVPFAFGWDIVVTNCEFTTVAP